MMMATFVLQIKYPILGIWALAKLAIGMKKALIGYYLRKIYEIFKPNIDWATKQAGFKLIIYNHDILFFE